MREILIQSISEIVQDPKIAKGAIVAGAGVSTGTIFDVLPATVGIVASLVTTAFTIYLWREHLKKNRLEDKVREERSIREQELHNARLKKLKARRVDDPKPELNNESKIK